MSREVPLSRGLATIVDDEDYDLAMTKRWTPKPYTHTTYAQAGLKLADGRWSSLLLHRLLMDAPSGLWVDHIDRNGLNNRRANLRFASPGQNQQNRGPNRNGYTHYKGVTWQANRQSPWKAQIRCGGKRRHLGYFPSPEEAALAYDDAAREHFGEFAWLNFPVSNLLNY